MRGVSLFILLYLLVGVLVAASVIGGEPNYFDNADNLEGVAEAVLAVLLWPLVLLDVAINLGGDSGGGGGGGGESGGGKGK